MDHDDRLATIRQWVYGAQSSAGSEATPVPPQVLADVLSLVEELTVTEEELRHQNDELAEARRLAEEALRKYEDLFEFAPDGYLVTDRSGAIAEANHVIGEMLRIDARFLDGKPLLVYVAREDRPRLSGMLADLPHCDRPISAIVQLVRRDESQLPARLTAALSPDHGAEPGSIRWIVHDLTDQRRTEVELARVQSMDSLGRLAGGIAHDFNNILTAALGTIRQTAAYVGDEEARAALRNAETALLDGAGLAQQLLTFARGGEPVQEVTSLEELIVGSAIFAVRGTNVRCEFEIPRDLWPASVDRRQVGQIVTNLVLNARQAMPEGGTIRVSARNVAPDVASGFGVPVGHYVEFAVADSGTGIERENLTRIFDPYFSTREDGSGLGLAVASSIVARHKGRITVESEPGAGSTFRVYLPAIPGEVEKPSAGEKAKAGDAGAKVLLVDDEVLINLSYGSLLRKAGYEVVTATSGAAAVARYRDAMEEGRAFDLVIMDLTLPGGIGGVEATRQIRQLEPDACVIVSSGYSTDAAMADFRAHGFSGVLAKPYTLEGLLEVIEICRTT